MRVFARLVACVCVCSLSFNLAASQAGRLEAPTHAHPSLLHGLLDGSISRDVLNGDDARKANAILKLHSRRANPSGARFGRDKQGGRTGPSDLLRHQDPSASGRPPWVTGPVCPAYGLPPAQRVSCSAWWEYDLDPNTCVERGCCYAPSNETLSWCHYPSPATPIKTLHVVQGCHFDAGFAKTITEILNLWFDKYFPLAFQVGKALAERNGTAQLHFTAQSWIASLYSDCPPNLGLHCPNTTELENFHEAVSNGWLTWHAFPFNAEPEIMHPRLFQYALNLTHELDAKFGVPRKTVFSQRDVPGLTRSALPLLKKHGVGAVSVGTNGGSTPPNVPKAFLWDDVATNTSLHAFYLSGGYGGFDFGGLYHEVTQVPGSSHAMVVMWRGDNAGPPPTPEDVENTWKLLAAEHPGVSIVPSTFDGFFEAISSVPASSFVRIAAEIGDTWVHGVASDPRKRAMVRGAWRAHSACIESGACPGDLGLDDPVLKDWARLVIKNGEHTDGLDFKSTIPSHRYNWSNPEFSKVRSYLPGYSAIEQSWNRQRDWGGMFPLQRLGNHPLASNIEMEWQGLTPVLPNLHGLVHLTPNNVSQSSFVAGSFLLQWNATSGALSTLVDRTTGVQWSGGAGSELLAVEYRTYDQEDYTDFMLAYSFAGPLFFVDDYDDFDKVGIDADGAAKHRVVTPTLESMWVSPETMGTGSGDNFTTSRFVLLMSMPDEVHTSAGSPSHFWLSVNVTQSSSPPFLPSSAAQVPGFDVTLIAVNKTATRLPEAAFIRFAPQVRSSMAASGSSSGGVAVEPVMEKLGAWVDPTAVVRGGNRHMHVVSDGGFGFVPEDTVHGPGMFVRPVDSGTVVWGEPTGFPVPTNEAPDFAQGGSLLLWDNIWDTNYALWYPFNPLEFNSQYRLRLEFGGASPPRPCSALYSQASLAKPSAAPAADTLDPASLHHAPTNIGRMNSTTPDAAFLIGGFNDDVYADPVTIDTVVSTAKLGAQWVAVEGILQMDRLNSSFVYRSPENAPSNESVVKLVSAAREAGLQVMLKILMTMTNPSDSWVFAAPADPASWFQSYGDHILQYAIPAREAGASAFCIGTELTHLSVHKQYADLWVAMIKRIRNAVPGMALTYGALYVVEYPNTTLWPMLDWIGIDAYFPLSNYTYPASGPLPTVESMSAVLDEHFEAVREWRAAAGLAHMPVVFPEIGYGSFATVSSQPSLVPSSCDGQFEPSFQAQSDAYEALFRSLANFNDMISRVFLFWLDNPKSSDYWGTPDGVPNGHKWPCFFTPRGKPAWDVIAKYMNQMRQ